MIIIKSALQESALDAPGLLKEGVIVTIMFNTEDSMPLSVDMPASVVLEVTHTEPGVKGKYRNQCNQTCECRDRGRSKVPLFINEGDKIKIDTVRATYMERAK